MTLNIDSPRVKNMRGLNIALLIALVTVAVAIFFVGYALTGADLCVWCPVTGR